MSMTNVIAAEGYTVYDEMACQVLLKTMDKSAAEAEAYNYQCVLFLDDKFFHDYSC